MSFVESAVKPNQSSNIRSLLSFLTLQNSFFEQTNAFSYTLNIYEYNAEVSFDDSTEIIYIPKDKAVDKPYLDIRTLALITLPTGNQTNAYASLHVKVYQYLNDLIGISPCNGYQSLLSNLLLKNIYSKNLAQQLLPTAGIKLALSQLVETEISGNLNKLLAATLVQTILILTLKQLENIACSLETCKFLEKDEDVLKIYEAKQLLLNHIEKPITIKELSKMVAMNECYLKKGFKHIFKTTIFDFFQEKRMQHATRLLEQEKLSVSEVSIRLGYSSISHFSTAFKKFTGIKPCTLIK